MDAVRYYLALLAVAFAPGLFLFWFSIHPFIRFWRKVGPKITLAIHFSAVVILVVCVVLVRKALFSIEFGTHPILMALGILSMALSIWLRVQGSKQFSMKFLTGIPELAPGRYENRLITDGIYARIRHPRYVEIAIAYLGYALFCNYLAVYVVLLLTLVWVPLVVWVEEKELRERFGEEYVRYCQRVPRFIPSF